MYITVNKDVIVYEEEHEIILINMIKNNFYTLDNVGTIIWKKIEESGEIPLLIDYIGGLFNVDKGTIQNDILEFIGELEKAGVIMVHE